MVRTALLAAGLAAIVAASWARLEQPRPGVGEFALIAALAVIPVLLHGRWRIVAIAGAGVLAASIALEIPLRTASPFDGRDFVATAVDRTWTGFLDFQDITVPFEGASQPLMHGALLMATFGFSLAGALAVAARRPPLALAALLFGAGWPATMFPGEHELARGGLILVAGLVLLAAVRPGSIPVRSQAFAAGAVVALALTLSTSSAVAKTQFVDWQSWDFYNEPDAPVGVSYVWRADYDGIKFPNKRTRVLRVRAPGTAGYWRATTLNAFFDDHWDERPEADFPTLQDGSYLEFSNDPLLPPAGRDPENWKRASVTVEALRDTHLVGASVPVAWDAKDIRGIFFAKGGIAIAERPLGRGQEYTAWNYAPRPKPQALARSQPDYPLEIVEDGYLDVDPGLTVPAFGAGGRERWLEETFAIDRRLRPYEALYEQAARVVGEADNPYAAVVALEAWFRTGGDFSYDETPEVAPPATPPLVFFLTQSKEGYCQHYAGAMALMLRYLGIPARVGAGFTSGIYDRDRRVWNVNDRNAHTWVEVWFEGFGWLPFDPTPGRGNLSGPYSASSFSFDAAGARDILATAGLGLSAAQQLLRFQLERNPGGSQRSAVTPRDLRRAPGPGEEGGGIGTTAIVILLLLGLAALLVAGKLALRRGRYLTRDPRRFAQAGRQELVEFLADQRIDVPRSATHEELRDLVRRQMGVDLRRLLESLGLARYGPTGAASAAARRARGELRLGRRRLRRALSTGARVRGAFSLRSLLAR